MDASVATPPAERQDPLLRRRSSIPSSVVVPTKLGLLRNQRSAPASTAPIISSTSASSSSSSTSSSTAQTFPGIDLELISIKPVSYQSLKDLIPTTAVNSPRPISPANQSQSGSEISIRNRLVKQAAWAYLQPMATSPGSTSRSFFHRLYLQLPTKNPVAALFGCFDRRILQALSRAVERLFRAFRVWSSR